MDLSASHLDPTDLRLLHRLSEGIEPDLTSAAADLDLTVEDIRTRFLSLVRQGVILDCAPRIDPATAGLAVTAFVMIRVAQNAGSLVGVHDVVRDIDLVEEAHAVNGPFDWLLKVRAENLAALQQLVSERLSLIPGFIRAESHIVLGTSCDHLNADAVFYPR